MCASNFLLIFTYFLLINDVLSVSEPFYETLFKNYDPNLLPEGDRPVTVNVNMHVKRINLIDEDTSQPHFELECILRFHYTDKRLLFDIDTMNTSQPGVNDVITQGHLTVPRSQKIWIPDTFFQNAHGSQPIEFGEWDRSIIVDPAKGVFISVRLMHRFACSSHFENYPYDEHNCRVVLASYEYQSSIIKYYWAAFNPMMRSDIPRMILTLGTDSMPSHYTTMLYYPKMTGCIEQQSELYLATQSCLEVTFAFFRQGRRHVMTLFGVPVIFVVISWFAFFMTKWSREGVLFILMLLVAQFICSGVTYIAYPIATESLLVAKFNQSSTGFLLAEACFLMMLGAVQFYFLSKNPVYLNMSMNQHMEREMESHNDGVTIETNDTRELVDEVSTGRQSVILKTPTARKSFIFWAAVRYGGLVMFIICFVIYTAHLVTLISNKSYN